jgi:predicted amidohydrolase
VNKITLTDVEFRRMKSLKIALLQDVPGSGIRPFCTGILERERPDVLALPEYYFVSSDDDSVIASSFRRDEILTALADLSARLGLVLVGGSLVEHVDGSLFNRCYIFDSGRIAGYYDKIHPFDNEGRGLIKEGNEYKVFDVRDVRIGILICADVLYPGSFKNIRGLQPDIIFVPTTSPYRPGENKNQKFARDRRVFVSGASRAACPVFKVCASGKIAGHRLQGRSLIALPGKIAWRIEPEFEHESALAIVRTADLHGRADLDIAVYRS